MSTWTQNQRGLSKDYSQGSQSCSSHLTDILAADTQNVKKNPTGSHLKGEWQGNWKLPPKRQIKSPQTSSLPSIPKCTERQKIKQARHRFPLLRWTQSLAALGYCLQTCTHLGNFVQQFVVFLSLLKSAQIAAHSRKQRESTNLLVSPELQGKWTARESPSRLDYCLSSVTSVQKQKDRC